MVNKAMKVRYRFRFTPTPVQCQMLARVSDARRDHLNKTTTDLVRRFEVIALEDLNVRGMVQNHALARAISDSALGEFRRMVEYKCRWYGRDLRLADRFYPSSRRCFDCGQVLEELQIGRAHV